MKRKILIVTAILMMTTAFLAGFELTDEVIAFRALEEGNYQGALEIYVKNNNNSGAGMAYLGLKRFDDAKEKFEKAGDQSGIGLAYCGKHLYDDAIKNFEQKKDNSGIGLAYCGKRDFDAARGYFKQANDYSGMGLAALGENKTDEAREWFTKVGDKGGLGLVLLAEKKYDDALKSFVAIKDNSGAGHAYCGKKDYSSAMTYFKKANDLSGLSLAYSGKNMYTEAIRYAIEANDYSALGHAYLGKHDYKEALDSFTKANDLSGIGFVYCKQKDFTKAAQYAKAANDLSLQGQIYLGAGDYKSAEDCFTAANDLSGLGLVNLKNKKYDKAKELFQKANDMSGLGFLYGEIGDYSKSEECFTKANDMSGLGRMALKRKQFNEAIAYFTKANDLDALGDLYWQLRGFDKAIECFKAEGDDVKVVQALREKKRRDPITKKVSYYGAEEAIAYAKAKIEEGKFVAPLHIEIGHIYSSRNDFENALKEYEAALNSDTYYAADALFWIGKTRYQQKNYQLAKEVFSSLVLKYPYHRLSYEARGAIKYLERSGKSSASLPANNICGPYALKLLLGNYGIEAATDDIAKAAGTDKEGTTMLGLIQAAKLSGLELSAFKTDSGKLNGYAGKAVLFINNSHYVFLKEVKAAGVLVTDNIADAYMTFSALDRCWQGQIIAVKTDPDIKEFAYDELVNIKGGNRRASEGGTTKNDPGLYPNGSLTLDYGKIGPIVPGDYLMMNNLSDSGTGHNPQPDGGMGITRMGTGENALGGQQCDAVFDPIAITGGQVIIPKEDIFIPCRGRKHGINLSLKRTYSSSSEVEGKMGFGWALAHDVKLLVVEAHDDDPEYVVVTAPDGTVFSYEYDGNGYYYQPECDGSYVLKNEDGTYYWMRRTVMYGTQKYYFEKYITETTTHRIKKIEDLNGNYLIYIYSGANLLRIFDNNSRYLYFTYLNGKISSVTGGTGSFYVTYNYGYDEDDNLTSVTGPEDYSETYEYEDASNIHNITAYVDAEGNRTVYTYEMDPSGISDVCVDVEDALGNHATYDYLFEIGVTTVVDARGRTSTYEYEKGKITKITNSNGEITNYSFDDAYMRNSITDEHSRGCGWSNKYHYGLVETLDNEEGHSAYFSYNSFNYIEWIVDAKTRTWSYEYDANGNLRYRHTLAPNNQGISTVEKQYNQYGCLTAVIDPENITTTYTYDSKGNILSETDGTGNYIGYTYDNLGRMTSSKYGDLGGYDTATTYDYDGLGRLIKKTYPDQSYEEYTYDKNSNLLTFTDANNHQTAYEYNALNQCVKVTDPESKITEYDYDAFGNMTELTRYVSGNPLTTYYEYNDHYNRLTKVTDPTGEMTVFTYEDSPPLLGDSKNYTTMKKYKPDNSLLAVETRTFDPMYRIKTVKDGLNNITTYNYDEVGNLISVVDQNEHTTTYTYDPNVNVVLTETDPLNNSTSYTYYKNGKLKTKTDANGNTTTYTYDAAGKLSLVTYEDDSTVEYAYNKYGKIFAMVDSLGTTVYSYNTRTWLTSVDGPNMNDTVSYTYDYAGNRATMVTPAGNFSYAYYANNLPYTLTNPQSQTTTFIYDTANRLTRMNYYNSTYTEWTYYNNDRVDTVTLKDGSQTTLASYNYDYSSLGKIATVTDNLSNTYNFTYNDAGRLTHEDKKDSQNNVIFGRDYSYDNAGNRTSETRDGVSVTLTYNNANQLTSRVTYSQTITYTYDNNGNLTQEVSNLTGTKTFAYEYENRPWRVTTAMPAATIYYGYSGDGRRTSTNVNGTVVKYIYDGLTPLIERDPSDNILATYTKIPSAPGGIGGLISSNDGTNTYYYHDSNLGNVNQMTNSAGAVVRTYDYDAFGYITAISGTVTTKYRYKTKEYSPEIGLVFFGRRYYNPLVGRFITKDPLGQIDGPNVYIYCNNDPVNKYDPWGLWKTSFTGPIPPGVDLEANIREAESMNPLDFFNAVKEGGKWDYKRLDPTKYEDFGNYNYGLTGCAAGFNNEILKRMAGVAQQLGKAPKAGVGKPWGGPPYGDEPKDQVQIQLGINDYAKYRYEHRIARSGGGW